MADGVQIPTEVIVMFIDAFKEIKAQEFKLLEKNLELQSQMVEATIKMMSTVDKVSMVMLDRMKAEGDNSG